MIRTNDMKKFFIILIMTSVSCVIAGTNVERIGYNFPIQIPDGVAVISIISDDPILTAHSVLYQECKKRGIPITLSTPSMISSLSPIQLYHATPLQLAEMLCKGGSTYAYHSTSHWQWQGHSDDPWFTREVAEGHSYGGSGTVRDLLGPPPVNPAYGRTQTVVETPGDVVAAIIQASGTAIFDTSDVGAEYITADCFHAPGQWYEDGEVEALVPGSEYWQILRNEWGESVVLEGASWVQSIPTNKRHDRQTIGSYSNSSQLVNALDGVVEVGGAAHYFAHEWLAVGETGGTNEGSARPGQEAYTDAILNATLVTFLDAIEDHVQAGNLIVMGSGAIANAVRGTPLNLISNSDFTIDHHTSASGVEGWGRVSDKSSTEITELYKGSDSGHDYVLINKKTRTVRIGFYTFGENMTDTEAFLITGWVKVSTGTTDPQIVIYGGDAAAVPTRTISSSVTRMVEPADKYDEDAAGQAPLGGLMSQPLYTYEFDGTEALAANGTWAYFTVPFSLPKPLCRWAIMLTTTNGDDSEIWFSDVKIHPNSGIVPANRGTTAIPTGTYRGRYNP
jgi:hypothetical protein